MSAGFTYFKDIKVVELAAVLAGPSVGMFFSELGAKVDKVEHPSGDMTRKWKLPSEPIDSSISGYYCSVNWGKEVHFLDLKLAADYEQLMKLIEEADILISNFKKGDDKKFNLTYSTVSKINPKIIYAHLNGYGEESARTAFDVVVQAESGFMSMNGQTSSPPTKIPVALMDVLAAHQLKEGILCALLERERTGKGSYVTASLLESGIASLANQATNYLMGNRIATRKGSLHPNIAPYGELFRCKDGKEIVLAVGTDKQFQTMCRILGNEEIASYPTFKTNQDRVSNRDKLSEVLAPLFLLFDAQELNELFIHHQVPAGIVKAMNEVMEEAEKRELILEEEVNGQLTRRVKSVVFEKKQ